MIAVDTPLSSRRQANNNHHADQRLAYDYNNPRVILHNIHITQQASGNYVPEGPGDRFIIKIPSVLSVKEVLL